MALETYRRCSICRSFLDEEDLFCSNCGTECPVSSQGVTESAASQQEQHCFDCQSCGASMSYDASAQALRCPFCGSTAMEQVPSRRILRCDWVVPFAVDFDKAEEVLRSWLGQGFWRPSDASRAAKLGEIAAVYVPFWVFEAVSDTKWTADASPAPAGSRGDWYPIFGEHRFHHRDIIIAGSSAMAPGEVAAIQPFHLDSAVHYDKIDLENSIVETLKVSRKNARPLARAAIEETESQICSRAVPGKARKVQVNVHLQGLIGYPVLLPVWMMAYHYRDQVHRVLINGQTGKIAGTAPFSYGKLTMVIVGIIAAGLALFLLALLLGALSG